MAIPCTHFISSEKAAMENGFLLGSPNSLSSPRVLTQDELKKIAAYKAVEYVESGMVIGLGTGSTAKHAVERIGELLHQGKLKNIIGIPTSKKTHEQAISCGIPLSNLDLNPVVDLAIDGADEVDPSMNLVKGRGGSLLREKMIESACKKFICIVDDTKLVNHLGGSGLAMPVEVVPFCWKFSAQRLMNLFQDSGCVAKLRTFAENGIIIDTYKSCLPRSVQSSKDIILCLVADFYHGICIPRRHNKVWHIKLEKDGEYCHC